MKGAVLPKENLVAYVPQPRTVNGMHRINVSTNDPASSSAAAAEVLRAVFVGEIDPDDYKLEISSEGAKSRIETMKSVAHDHFYDVDQDLKSSKHSLEGEAA